jgi:RNA polymerase sigma factor (sigma-70 family)
MRKNSFSAADRNMQVSRQDHLLVQDCLHGNEEAWSALIDRYKNLIFSIPIKHGFSNEDAADIFQAVCLSLVSELPRLREPRALPAWLIQTTAHKCFRWKDQNRRYLDTELEQERLPDQSAKIPQELLEELEREQMVRAAVSELSTDCKRLVELLFYQAPTPSYDDLAAALDIPKGSIGPTRMRCLEKVRRLLEEKGF